MTDKELENIFTFHPVKDDQAKQYEGIRNQGRILAMYINEICQESREKSTAITKIQEAVMWANAAKAIHE